jgi:DNA-binding LacI/PurR family transcriptional regulator
MEGYTQALHEAGLPVDEALTDRGDWSATSGYHTTQQLLNEGQSFTALVAQNDQMAVGAIKALREAGRQVPEDVSVIGFDDIPLASYFDPPLTTLRQPMQESGERAARLLIESIRSPERPQVQVLIRAKLIQRSSCASPP